MAKAPKTIGSAMPDFVEFQHPKLVSAPPVGPSWLHEVKIDGYRLQARVQAGQVTLHTRSGHDWTEKFPELAAELAVLPDVILDGELAALGQDGQPNFSLLRTAISRGSAALVYFAFDILWRGTEDMRTAPQEARKAALAQVIEDHLSDRLRRLSPLPGEGPDLLHATCEMGLEGIVSKRLTARYEAGKRDVWVKAKCRPSQEVVIGGWLQEPGRHFQGLLVGVYEGDALRYAGSVKTGFSSDSDLPVRLRSLETETSPFAIGRPRRTREVRWARPELVANVAFAEWTMSGRLRQASFKGLREDKQPTAVIEEDPEA
jgi:bifunctional non-homologous end joining protein LigD